MVRSGFKGNVIQDLDNVALQFVDNFTSLHFYFNKIFGYSINELNQSKNR